MTTEERTTGTQAVSAARVAPTSVGEMVFAGDGKMASLMRAKDWSQGPMGPVDQWPQSLRTAVSICLASRFPILLWWGSDLVMLYNDAYSSIIAEKHPAALGQRGRECFPEIWEIIGPMLDGVYTRGEATWSQDQLLLLERNGYPEECYFTFSYSPIRDEGGGIGGIFTAVTETTPKLIGERRLRTLRELAATVAEAESTEEVCALAAGALASNPDDLPFALLYLVDTEKGQAALAGAVTGVTVVSPAWAHGWAALSKETDSETDAPDHWHLGEVSRRGEAMIVSLDAATGPWPRHAVSGAAPSQALVLPIAQPVQGAASSPYGFLVAGISPHRALDGEYRSFLELVAGQIARGIADARAYQEERKRAEALAELDRAKTAFFSNVSHEFRTPLTLLLAPLEDALADAQEPLPPRQRERGEIAHRNALRLLKLVNTLLDFSRIEAGRIQARYEPTDLAHYTAELASVFRSATERAGLRLVVDCPPLPEPVYVDRDMWEKIVLNLLSNAFKFTFEGEIEVRLHVAPQPASSEGEGEAGGSVELVVRDTGVGIPAADLPHIFERFHRVSGSLGRTQEGSGIGLALVQDLARLHGGTAQVTSIEGEGTTFTITLPLGMAHLPADRVSPSTERPNATTQSGAAPFVEEAQRWLPSSATRPATADEAPPPSLPSDHHSERTPKETVATEEPPGVPTGVTGARILIADDNADMREYVARLLGERYRVELVADGASALAAIRRQPPDLVLTDVMMSGLDGFALLRTLRADPLTAAIPVILLSARAGEEATAEGIAAGADDYIVKPFQARELLVRIAARLEIARARHEVAARAREMEVTLQTMVDGVMVYDAHGTLVRMNRAARELFGMHAVAEYASRPHAELGRLLSVRDLAGNPVPFEEWPTTRVLRGEVLTGERALDFRVRNLSGRDLELNYGGAPIHSPDGTLVGAVLVVRDVTTRRRLERRTRESLDALLKMARTLVLMPPDAMSVRAEDGTSEDGEPQDDELHAAATRLGELVRGVIGCERVALVRCDAALAQEPLTIVGIPEGMEEQWRATLAGTHLSDYLSAEEVAQLRAGETLRLDATPPRRHEATIGGNATIGGALALVNPMRIGEQLVGTLTIDFGPAPHNYTEEEMALANAVASLVALLIERDRLLEEREAARANALALAQANRRMDEFLGIASHELKTPITSMKANVQMLRHRLELAESTRQAVDGQRATDAEQLEHSSRRLIERTDRGIARLTRLVDDLLDVSRIQTGKLQLRLEPMELSAVVREGVEEQREANPKRTISLELPDESLPVRADADRIAQVVTNYLTNALKYSQPDQPVELRVSREGDAVRVAMRDYGQGIPEPEHEHIWDRFYRAPGIDSVSGSGVGLGLGLYISKSIVERHGGMVGIESPAGGGSRFWFTLPLTTGE